VVSAAVTDPGSGNNSATQTTDISAPSTTTGGSGPPPPGTDPCQIQPLACAASAAADGLLVRYNFDNPADPWADSGPNGYHASPAGGVSVVQLGNGNRVARQPLVPGQPPDGALSFEPHILNCFTDSASVSWWCKSERWWEPTHPWYHTHRTFDGYCIGFSTHMVNFVATDGAALRGNPLYDCGAYAVGTTCAPYATNGGGCCNWCAIFYMVGCCGSNVSYGYVPTEANYANWRHWAFVRDGNASMKMYLNGVQVMSRVPPGSLQKCWNLAVFFGYSTGGTLPYPGWLDDFRVYQRALTPAELTAMAGSPPE
jgi:hypothetical protein